MATYGLLSDVHLTRRAPANCTDSYLPDLMDLLAQAFGVFREREVAAAVIAGDLFHHKAPTRTDHSIVRELGRLFRAAEFDVWVTPGNHDMQNDRQESVSSTQPLGVLFDTGVAHCLDGWMGGDHPVFGVPWQQHWSAERIAECLRPYREQVYGAGLGNQRPLIVTHAPIYPPSCEPRYDGAELTPADWWTGPLQADPGSHSVFYGHIHERHGTWARRSVEFCNNGALSRGSLGEDNLTRQIGVTLWDSATGAFEFAPLDARPAQEVFRLREHGEAVTSQMSLDAFMDGLGTTVLPRLEPESVLARFREDGADADEIALAEELLDWAGAEGKVKR
jgi:DNA repair exonuclease SbcCD nuclease subunit